MFGKIFKAVVAIVVGLALAASVGLAAGKKCPKGQKWDKKTSACVEVKKPAGKKAEKKPAEKPAEAVPPPAEGNVPEAAPEE